MIQLEFSPLPLATWRPTRDTLHSYSKLLGKIRSSLTPRQKHWWHKSLHVVDHSLSTTDIPMPSPGVGTFEMRLDLQSHLLLITTSDREKSETPLVGQSVHEFCDQALAGLAKFDIYPDINRDLFADLEPRSYDRQEVETYASALTSIDMILKQFKATLSGETSPVQLWPHHFDLALMWLTGRKVPCTDPEDEEYADEQMAFGFSTGDEGVPDPYTYVTAYPWPEGFEDQPLPAGATWHLQGWKGALLMYAQVVEAEAPQEELMRFLKSVYEARKTSEGW